MDDETPKIPPILNLAWTRFAHFDAASKDRNREQLRLRRWIAILGVLASLFAILTEIYSKDQAGPESAMVSLVLKTVLIITPLASSALAAFSYKFFGSGDGQIMRAGAEEILKEIFMYRTILQKAPDRRIWLEKRLEEIQHNVYRALGGAMVLRPYDGPIPPHDDQRNPADDAGFDDLNSDQYFKFRVEHQLGWHLNQVNKIQAERVWLQVLILLAGVAAAFMAAWGGSLSIWVALAASISMALIGWQELRGLEDTLKIYSKVVLELMAIYDHWNNLEPHERTSNEYYNMVRATEHLLWNQNIDYIKSVQEVMARFGREDNGQIAEDARISAAQEEAGQGILGSLAADASSDVVQAELAAMQQTMRETLQNISLLRSSLQQIAAEYSGVDGNTPVATLNALIARLPTTGEVKG